MSATADEGEHLETKTTCAACGANIVQYHEHTRLLPDEVIGDRRATHSWLVCQLRAEQREVAARIEQAVLYQRWSDLVALARTLRSTANDEVQ